MPMLGSAGAALLHYFLNRTLSLSIAEASSGSISGIRFER